VRTTITIELDVALLLDQAMNEQKKTLDEVVNASLRQTLADGAKPPASRYTLAPRNLGVREGVNLDKASQFGDDLADQELIRKWQKGT
jgi:hypothetical protein